MDKFALRPLALEVALTFVVVVADADVLGDVRAALLEVDVAPHATPAPKRRGMWKVRNETGSDKYIILAVDLELDPQGQFALNLEHVHREQWTKSNDVNF